MRVSFAALSTAGVGDDQGVPPEEDAHLDGVASTRHDGCVQIIEVTGLGVRSAVIRLRRRETPLYFTIYPMIHVARPQFYADVAKRLRKVDVIVAEGVHGRPSLAMQALMLSYRITRWNRRVNLVEQHVDYKAIGVPVVRPDVSTDEFATGWRRIPLGDRLLMYLTLPVIIVARLFGGTESVWNRAVALDDLPSPEEEALEEAMPQLAEALGGERDDRLLAALYRLHEERADESIEVAVVYGAGHVPVIVRGLADRFGYKPRSADWLTVADL